MASWFEEDYTNTCSANTNDGLSAYTYEQIGDLDQYVSSLTELKETIANEVEQYDTLTASDSNHSAEQRAVPLLLRGLA